MAVGSQDAALYANATAMSNSGMWFFPSLTAMERETTRRWNIRILIRAWGWSAWPALCREWITSSWWIRCRISCSIFAVLQELLSIIQIYAAPEDAISKLVNNCDRKLTEEIREEIAASGMTIDQVMTLASMIQAEAADEEDMYMISSVFHNRLNSDGSNGLLRLQSDPTMYYPYRTKSAIPEDIRETYSSKYNTYEIEGLPTGPICNPGAKAIDAALHPKATDYYYFCHDADRDVYKRQVDHQRFGK